MINKTIDNEINKTKFKVLFNSLIVESETYLKIQIKWVNGFCFNVFPIENTQINRLLIKI